MRWHALDSALRVREYAVNIRSQAMDVGSWLRNFGLGQYESSFRENEIDSEVLRNLTSEDLKDQ